MGPIRGELLGPQQLAERAKEVAAAERLVPGRKGLPRTRLLARLEETRKILEDAHERLGAVDRDVDLGPAGDWFLDNYHVVREHIREVRDGLPKSYYRELPELATGQLAGYPRVYELAITLISHTEGRADLGNVDLFVGAFQEVAPLSIGELWAIPAMLRLGLIENVRRMTLRTVQRLDEIERADRWAARLQAANDAGGSALGAALGEFVSAQHDLNPDFVSRFLHQLRLGAGALPALVWLEQWIHEEGMAPEDAVARSTQRLALTQLMMANSITSLRAIGRMDWRTFVERRSRMEAVLRDDPSGDYARMDFATRDRYRHVVEGIAKRSGVGEEEVALEAVKLARSNITPSGSAPSTNGTGERDGRDPRRTHVGYYLIDKGRAALEEATHYEPDLQQRFRRWILRNPNMLFVGGIASGTVVALVAVFWLAGSAAFSAWLAVLLLALIPANDIAVSVMSRLVTALMPPSTLPKLDFTKGGVPDEFRTAVVVPTLFGSTAAVRDALENLEVQFLANRDARLKYAILGDFTDSPTEHREDDDAIVSAAVEGVKVLNERYAVPGDAIFFLFHRPRRWNARQGVWMGWERKRGKLAQFNHFVEGVRDDAFSVVTENGDTLRGTRYVITLDSDTMLPPDSAAELAGAMAHPLNRAWYDPELGRVTRGYAILQPRVGVWLPSAYRSRFAVIHSGHPGVDPYTTAVSDVYQDLYHEGSFTGKGIYDVAAFERATRGRFPENRLLSHDLIEGSFARAGLATDITVFDEYPSRYLTFTRRKHRWIRGDWQLLQWLTPRVPGPDGPEPNRLSILSRWKIFDNLRRSTVEIAMLAFLIAGWTFLPGSPLRWTVLGVLAIATPWIVSLLLAALRPPFDKSWRAYYAAMGEDTLNSVEQVALALTFLPHQAWVSADAIVRTLYRMFVSRRSLLEWQSASHSERAVPNSASFVWRRMWPAILIAAAAGTLVIALHSQPGSGSALPSPSREWLVTIAVLPLVGLWLLSPVIAQALSAPALRRMPRLRAESREDALRYARLHWEYFDHFATAETNWLAPDNFQDDPAPVVAMRTSPTNIGLQLLATVSARDLDFISIEEMTRRLESVFASLDRLARLGGHFYNWYDPRNLSVLEPAYVSTVDSGNLAGHLIALRQACLGIAAGTDDVDLRGRLTKIAERAYEFALGMDFDFLYDDSRKLFSVGYQVANHTLDESYYDLLASEARLASFVAIAKHDVPVAHWFHLGRALTRASGETALVSWSGSMFEYLMPALVMRSYPFTLLAESYRSVVRRQMAYGNERGVPWGISESAYNLRDRHLTYQYRAFGVPDLALKRGLGRDLVVAPYATALAAMIAPRHALDNFARLETRGALGIYGFRDALDFTRPQPGHTFAVVHNYMAHHAGMSFVSLTNALLDRVWLRRFHADPLVRSADVLLHERMPRRLVLEEPQEATPDEALPRAEMERPAVREIATADTPRPEVALLGHLPYTIMVTNGGSGYSRYEELAVTRWRADGTRDDTGSFIYVKDLGSGRTWSTAYQPTCTEPEWYRAVLASDRVTFLRVDDDIETRTEIAVVPEDAAEVRRVTVTNYSSEERELELTSYGEIVLGDPDMERAHPAFANLFVETEYHDWCTAITATRRPRSSKERELWCVHVVDGSPAAGPVSCETDRARFVGRGRSTRNPIALERDGELSGTTGAVLDPVFALRSRVKLAPGASASVAFATLVADSIERAFELADRYHDSHNAQRALDLAWTRTQIELRELDITPADAAVFQEIAGRLFYGGRAMRAPEEELLRNHGTQQRLWSIGVSGDWPILLARIESVEGLPTLRQLFAAHRYWRRRGMMVDLVILNERPTSYLQELHDRIMAAMFGSSDSGAIDQPGGVFIRRMDQLDPTDLLMLRATARVHVECDGRSLGRIVKVSASNGPTVPEGDDEAPTPRPPVRSTPPSSSVVRRIQAGATQLIARQTKAAPSVHGGADDPAPEPGQGAELHRNAKLHFDNGIGGFDDDNGYTIFVNGDQLPEAPWANVVANPNAGFVITERGGGFSWAVSSYFYRLTPWHNDPVSDPASDVLYLRDEESGEVWSATPAPVEHAATFEVRHFTGASTFQQEYSGIGTTLEVGVPPADPVKLSLLRITNRSERRRRISVTPFVEWTLGVLREHTRHQVHTTYDAERGSMFASNHFDEQFTDWVAFLAMSEPPASHTADRREFLGRNGDQANPAAMRRAELGNRTGAGIDPCGALRAVVDLAPGEAREIVVALGAARGQEEASRLADEYRSAERARAAMESAIQAWEKRLSTIEVTTPEPSFDAVANRWTLYQALSCRMWARSALYQSSGAYGFRDQLQDVMAFVYSEPAIAREHIVRSAARQFVEGDVQHWWHPQSGRGVRTRFSDDLVWLPFVVNQYLRVTGDTTILDEDATFLEMRQLEPGEQEVYDLPRVSTEHASIYEHCLRALRKACTSGPHELPLIGSGDWNDGMNRVGVEGRGESVWLAWFLIATLRPFAEVAEARGDAATAEDFRKRATAYAAAAEKGAWDGEWYRRAYFDDGTPLGSASNEECRIDSIAQSWSIISDAGDPERRSQALQSLEKHLVREDARLIMLLTPPFDHTTHDPGYIKGYVPGVRENGAQYTHAALWAVLATALHGDGRRAFELFQMLNPLNHASTPERASLYKVEPYVVAADVYTATGHVGRGGWTWYTGSASWMYRVALESILGFDKRGDTLRITPRVPAEWPELTIVYRFGESEYTITVHEPGRVAAGAVVRLDGRVLDDGVIPLEDDSGKHEVVVAPR